MASEIEPTDCSDFELVSHKQDPPLKVLFIHGGGWHVGQDLADQPFSHFLRKHFPDSFHVESMANTSEFEKCIMQQARAIQVIFEFFFSQKNIIFSFLQQ
jgi:hypothetical protein